MADVVTLSKEPIIFQVDDFLSEEECDSLIAELEPNLAPATITTRNIRSDVRRHDHAKVELLGRLIFYCFY